MAYSVSMMFHPLNIAYKLLALFEIRIVHHLLQGSGYFHQVIGGLVEKREKLLFTRDQEGKDVRHKCGLRNSFRYVDPLLIMC